MTRAWPVLFIVLLAIVAVPVFVGSSSPTASAAPREDPAEEVVGRWSGFARCGEGQVVCALDVLSAKNRRFEGELHGLCAAFAVEGTLSAAGVLNLEGDSVDCDGFRLKAHGRVKGVDGTLVAGLAYEITDGKGKSVDCGDLVLMQLHGGAGWDETEGTDVTGPWAGDAPSKESPLQFLSIELMNLAGRGTSSTAVTGDAVFFDLPLPGGEDSANVMLQIVGSISGAEGGRDTPDFAVIGADEKTGIIAILIGIHGAGGVRPAIAGEYMLFANTEGFDGWLSNGKGFSAGSYDVFFQWGITYKLLTPIPGEEYGSTVSGTITFPATAIGDSKFAIENAVAFDFHVNGYSPAGPGWSSSDPNVTVHTDDQTPFPGPHYLTFRVGKIGDRALVPYVTDQPDSSKWFFGNATTEAGAPQNLQLNSKGGSTPSGRWVWNFSPFSIEPPSYDGADALSQGQPSWYLAR